ncbi:MAG TPA: GNAT family N-acetyltransferase [Steroidobacteraceae bacterium]
MRADATTVEHDAERNRFVTRFPEGDAKLVYKRLAARTLDLTHTYVPPVLRGRGVADALVRAALAHARQQQLKIVPTCPYVERWFEKHPQERDVITTRPAAT